jgi:hypothetical protein
MASKKIYTIVAVAGILTASSVAWWYQNANKSSMGITVPGGPGGPGGLVALVALGAERLGLSW